MVAPFTAEETDHVAMVVADMFGSFRSMRHSDEEAVAIVDRTMRAVATFPGWAIESACKSIQFHGVWREGKLDRQWPPNDSEIVLAVRESARLYADSHHAAIAMLEAAVEQ